MQSHVELGRGALFIDVESVRQPHHRANRNFDALRVHRRDHERIVIVIERDFL